MSEFLSKLDLQDNEDRTFTLLNNLIYNSDYLKSVIVVPSDFKTDLASIPRGLWNILPPIGEYDRAAVVHDFLYKTGKCPGHDVLDRGDADRTLLEAMDIEGVGRFKKWLIYLGVRAGGWVPWNRYREDEG